VRFGVPVWEGPERIGTMAGAVPPVADTVVVGGGFTGLATAYALAKAGRDVVLLEAREIGYGASSRNAGFCTIGPSASVSAVLDTYGASDGARYYRWFQHAVGTVQKLVDDEMLDVEWRVSGRLSLARSARQTERLRRNFQIQRDVFGLPVDFLEGDALKEQIGASAFVSAITDRSSACLNPRKLVGELVRIASKYGASIHENVPVVRLRESSSDIEVRHQHGVVRAQRVVVATNGYSESLGIGAHHFTVPLGSFIVATEPLSPDAQRRLLPTGKVASTISNYSNYFRLLADGTLLFGGRKSLASSGDFDVIGQELIAAAGELFGSAVELPPVAACWGGRLAFTRDRTPRVGHVSERVLFAGGYCGHGVPTSVSAGFALARYLRDGDRNHCPFFSDAIGPSIGYRIGRSLMPLIGAYYLAQDRKDLKQN
jgi:glycine/D-amino acid oxidase-like deaminating enzyme